MSRTKRVLEGLGANYVAFAIRYLVRFFVTPFYLATIGPELMGLRSFVDETLRYLSLTGLGGRTSIAAIVSKELQPGCSSQEREKVLRTLRAGGQLQLLLALVAFCLVLVFALKLDSFTQGLSPENVVMAKWCAILFGMSFSLYIASGIYSGILTGKQLVGQTSLYNAIGNVMAAAVGVLLVYLGWSLYGIAIASLIAAVFVFIQYQWRTAKLGIRLGLFRGPIELESMPRLLKLLRSW